MLLANDFWVDACNDTSSIKMIDGALAILLLADFLQKHAPLMLMMLGWSVGRSKAQPDDAGDAFILLLVFLAKPHLSDAHDAAF